MNPSSKPEFESPEHYKECFLSTLLPALKQFMAAGGWTPHFLCAAAGCKIGSSFEIPVVTPVDQQYASGPVGIEERKVTHVVTNSDLQAATPEMLHDLLVWFWEELPDDPMMVTPEYLKILDYITKWRIWRIDYDIPDESNLLKEETPSLKDLYEQP